MINILLLSYHLTIFLTCDKKVTFVEPKLIKRCVYFVLGRCRCFFYLSIVFLFRTF